MSLRVGIWGAGYMGRTHGRILRRDPRVALSAFYDIDLQRRKEAAVELECPAVHSPEQLLEKVDAVYITVPNTSHAEAATQALQSGKHVFCEKPFTTSLDDARKLRDLAGSAGKVLAVGHNRRFAPVYQTVKKHLQQDGLKATLAHFKMNRGELESPIWVSNRSLTGGYLYETPYHLFDMARWLFGEVAEIEVRAAGHAYAELDNFSILLRFESELSLTFASCAHATWHFPFERVEIFGRSFTLETEEMERVSLTRGLAQSTVTHDFHSLPLEERWGYTAIDANFISAALGEEPAAVTAEDGYRTVEIVNRCYAAARNAAGSPDDRSSDP